MLDGVRYPDIRISTLAGRSPGPSLRHSEVVINLANSFMATLAAVDPDPQVALGAVFLDQLRTFIAAVDEGSFSAAAPKLLRARSMVSETVSNLEEQIGVPLFDRSGRYPKLTPEGVVLLADARNIITGVDLLKARAEGMSVGLEPELSVIVDVFYPIDAITQVAREFRQQRKDVATLQLPADHHPTGSINAMNLKD